MNPDFRHDEFVSCLLRADRPAATQLIQTALHNGIDPHEILLHVVQPSMQQVGQRWSRRQASLTQYYVAGKIADDITDMVTPLLTSESQPSGRVVIGTISGDYHGLGRKIVAAFLRAAGFCVRDLGLGATPTAFVDAAREESADVVAVSSLMAHTVDAISAIRPLLRANGAEHVRLIVGGAPFNYDRRLYAEVGADATARNAGEAVRVMQRLVRVAV